MNTSNQPEQQFSWPPYLNEHNCQQTKHCRSLSTDETSPLVFQHMPLSNLLPRFGHHVIPMARFHGSAATPENYSTNQFIPADLVKVHDADFQVGLTNFLPRNVEDKRLVVCRVQGFHLDARLLLLHSCGSVKQPNFHIWICDNINNIIFIIICYIRQCTYLY